MTVDEAIAAHHHTAAPESAESCTSLPAPTAMIPAATHNPIEHSATSHKPQPACTSMLAPRMSVDADANVTEVTTAAARHAVAATNTPPASGTDHLTVDRLRRNSASVASTTPLAAPSVSVALPQPSMSSPFTLNV